MRRPVPRACGDPVGCDLGRDRACGKPVGQPVGNGQLGDSMRASRGQGCARLANTAELSGQLALGRTLWITSGQQVDKRYEINVLADRAPRLWITCGLDGEQVRSTCAFSASFRGSCTPSPSAANTPGDNLRDPGESPRYVGALPKPPPRSARWTRQRREARCGGNTPSISSSTRARRMCRFPSFRPGRPHGCTRTRPRCLCRCSSDR